MTAAAPLDQAGYQRRVSASGLAAAGVPGTLLLSFAVGYYLYADLPVTPQLRLPAAGAVVGGWGLLIWHLGRLRVGDLSFAAAIFAITLASVALNPAFYEDGNLRAFASDYATSYVVFLVSLPMALGVMTGLRQISTAAIARWAFAAALLILLGAAAERFAGFAAVSEPVRAALFPAEIVYAEDLRDQLVYGAVRAKLFTSEPSHVAKSFILALLVWYAAARKWWRAPVFYVLLAAGVLLVKSPGLLVALPAAWAADFCRMRRSGWLVLLILGGCLAAAATVMAGQALFPERFAHIASGRDGSFMIRAGLPLQVMGEVWTEHPVFGLGFGAKESGIPYAIAAAQTLQIDLNALLGTNAPLGNNGLFIAMIQLGCLGCLLFALALLRFWRFACGPYWPFTAIALLSYLTLIGGINDPRFWGGFALLTASAAAAARREAAEAPQRHGSR